MTLVCFDGLRGLPATGNSCLTSTAIPKAERKDGCIMALFGSCGVLQRLRSSRMWTMISWADKDDQLVGSGSDLVLFTERQD